MDNWVKMNYLLKVRKSPNTYAGVIPILLLNKMCFMSFKERDPHNFLHKKWTASSTQDVSEPTTD